MIRQYLYNLMGDAHRLGGHHHTYLNDKMARLLAEGCLKSHRSFDFLAYSAYSRRQTLRGAAPQVEQKSAGGANDGQWACEL